MNEREETDAKYQAVAAMADVFRVKLSEDGMRLYLRALGEIPARIIIESIHRATRYRDRWPVPADILVFANEMLHNEERDRARRESEANDRAERERRARMTPEEIEAWRENELRVLAECQAELARMLAT